MAPGQRVPGKGPVARHQLQRLEPALLEQHSVEGIARPRLWGYVRQGVAAVYVQDGKRQVLQQVRKTIQRNLCVQLAEAGLDRDLPQAGKSRRWGAVRGDVLVASVPDTGDELADRTMLTARVCEVIAKEKP